VGIKPERCPDDNRRGGEKAMLFWLTPALFGIGLAVALVLK
jgi:hypothetical protein